ncbi:uncharacterized protein LOC118194190 [Stegodyphus dumicola]|uniref:uncharacterized protein LOC118194190 n=1 Tax=Stegodyphus dumicola TaxID=202533 RepID=UPI0015AC89BD|nr:uncharacterized protein LOC118194190 [Stegodyphus dumicola]
MMKLTLSLPVLIILGKFVFAQAYLMRDLDFTRPLPLRIELNSRPRRTCIDHNGRCALITYNVADRKYIRVLDTTCNCDEGTECLYDRDILTDCEGNEDCLLSRNLLFKFQSLCLPICLQA